jgi:hypothetical protein
MGANSFMAINCSAPKPTQLVGSELKALSQMGKVDLRIGNGQGGVDPPVIAGRKKRHFIAVHEVKKGGNLVAMTAVVLGRNLMLTSFVRLDIEVEQHRPAGQAPGFGDQAKGVLDALSGVEVTKAQFA